MRYKKFGNSDLETSVVGFGGWPMGSGHYGSFDEQQVIAKPFTAPSNWV